MESETSNYYNELKAVLERFENSVSLENLKKNQKIIDLMDDNLGINIIDYLNLFNIRENFQNEKDKLIASLAGSDRYIFDEHSGMIKLKEKPKRRLIVFRDIPKSHQKKDELISFFKLSGDKNYDQLITKYEFSNELFFVYFNDEETTIEVFKWIEYIKENEKNLPFNFSAFVKVENLKTEFTKTNGIEENANETLKIISNTREYVPRKISSNEESKQPQTRKESKAYSKFDKYDTSYTFTKPLSQVHNKYDYINNDPKKEKRTKAYSIHENYYQPHDFMPLNKNYNFDNNNLNAIEFKYSLNDISRIFINMNFMKKFDQPENLEDEKISEIFNEKPKSSLVIFQFKKEHLEVRERAYTFHDKPKKYEKNDYYGYNNHYRNSKRGEYI